MTTFHDIIATCHNRWLRGAEDFRTRLLRHPPTKRVIRSAIYGDMEFGPDQMLLIESFYLQRMRGVSQMGLLNLVYPDARHSRFEHSLGVLHSLSSLLTWDKAVKDALSPANEINPLLCAAVLHDCGHGPFSHTTETLLRSAGLDADLRLSLPGEPQSTKPHERRARDMILDSDFQLKRLKIEGYGLSEALRDRLEVAPETVVGLIVGKKDSALVNLVSGPFDVDKMDYFRRDAFFTGTTGGGVDMDALKRFVRIVKTDRGSVVAFDRRLVGHLLHLLSAREHVYNIGAFHPVARASAALLLVAGDLAIHALPDDMLSALYLNIELLADHELLMLLEVASNEIADTSAERGSDAYEAGLLSRVVRRLYLRRLHKKLEVLSRAEFAEFFAEAIESVETEHSGDVLPQVLYVPISEIGNGRFLKHLEGYKPQDDVAILETSPSLGPIGKGADKCERELGTLKEIMISSDPAPHTVMSLADWLDRTAKGANARDDFLPSVAQAQALRAHKLATWKALVLVPDSIRRAIGKDKKERTAFLRAFADALAKPSIRRPTATYVTHSKRLGVARDEIERWQTRK